MRVMICGALAAAWVLVAPAAQAADWPVYFGASYGLATVDGTASTDGGTPSGFPPESLPLDGLPFDDEDGAWSAFAGYQINKYVGLELGYSDLGDFGTDINMQTGSVPPVVSMESIHLAARFRYPLTDTISATWHLGISENDFEVDGSNRILVVAGPIFGPIIEEFDVPFSKIDNETGYQWGFGFHWQFSKRVSSAIEFTRHDVRAFEVDAFNVRMLMHL